MFQVFRWLKDQGEDRSFQYRDEFFMGTSGAGHQNADVEPNAATCALIADAFYAAAQGWARRAAELQRRERTIIDGQMIDSMISGR